MKAWLIATAALALASALVGVGVALHGSANAAGLAATLQTGKEGAQRDVSAPRATAVSPTSATAEASVGAEAAVSAPIAAANAEPAIAPESLPALIRYRQTSTYNGAPVYVPENCQGRYDVVLHFHGAHPYVRELFEKSGVPAVVAVFNAGNGAERYSQTYRGSGMLRSLLRQVDMAASALCSGEAQPGRVALTAWSAGYAAVEKLLAQPEDRARVDAVLLADGLHAAFVDRWKRSFAPNALQAFREFGELAKSDHKLFAITHSSIATDAYGSTTECSRLLLDALGVPVQGALVAGKSGNFSIEGSSGDDKAAHIAQFRQMHATLLSKLRMRWSD